MKQKRHTTEEIMRLLREADGGMEPKDARKYRQLEKENPALQAADARRQSLGRSGSWRKGTPKKG